MLMQQREYKGRGIKFGPTKKMSQFIIFILTILNSCFRSKISQRQPFWKGCVIIRVDCSSFYLYPPGEKLSPWMDSSGYFCCSKPAYC